MRKILNILAKSDRVIGLSLRLLLLGILLSGIVAATSRWGNDIQFLSGLVTIGDSTTAGTLDISDGSSNTVGIDTQALSTDWDISLPPPPAGNDYLLNIDTDGTMSTIDPASLGGGGGASITSPDTQTSVTAADTGGVQVIADTTTVADLQATASYFYDDLHIGPTTTGVPNFDFWLEGGSGVDWRLNRNSTGVNFNFGGADLDTTFVTTVGSMMRIDGGDGQIGVGGEVTPDASFHLEGSLAMNYALEDVSFTYDPAADQSVVLLDADGADLTVTLPNPSAATTYRVTFVRVDVPSSTACILDASGATHIQGALTVELYEQWETITLQAGSNADFGGSTEWVVVSHTKPFDVLPGVVRNITSVTGTYTVADNDEVLIVNTLLGALDVDLPAASGQAGRVLVIIDSRGNFGTNACSVDPNGTEMIDGTSTSLALNTNYQGVTIVCDGSGWFTVQ